MRGKQPTLSPSQEAHLVELAFGGVVEAEADDQQDPEADLATGCGLAGGPACGEVMRADTRSVFLKFSPFLARVGKSGTRTFFDESNAYYFQGG